jgi:hypothetical protein
MSDTPVEQKVVVPREARAFFFACGALIGGFVVALVGPR